MTAPAATTEATNPATTSATTDPTTTATTPLWPSDRWLSHAATHLPPLTGPAGTAERLLLCIHYGIDWQTGWVSNYRATYWEQLLPTITVTSFPARVRASCRAQQLPGSARR